MKKVVKKKRVKKSPYTLHKSSRGISKVIILAVVAILLALGGGYYILGSKSGMPSVPGMGMVNKATLNPNCELKDPELCRFMNNWQTQKNYSVTTTSKMGGESVESMYEMDGDNFHSVTKQNGKENANMISIGDTTYMLDYTDKKWWKMTTSKPNDEVTKETKESFAFDDKEKKDTTTYKFITKEACGSYTCFKYEVITTDSNGMKQFMWFDDSEYLMRKLTIEDPQNGSSESVFTYGNAHVLTPSPVKDEKPDSMNTTPGYGLDEQKMMQEYQKQSQSNDTEQPVEDTSSSDYR